MNGARRASRHPATCPDSEEGKHSGVRIALSQVGECLATGCRAPVFAELSVPGMPQLCFNCVPPFVEQQERFRNLFERTGGRLPANFWSHLSL